MRIFVIYSSEHKLHNPKWEFFEGRKIAHREIPERIEMIRIALERRRLGLIITPSEFSLEDIYTVHNKEYVGFIKNTSSSLKRSEVIYPKEYSIDMYTPILSGTYKAARLAADCALTAAVLIRNGESLVYALCRPPGHHAETRRMGGYCYFNSAAIAAQCLSKNGKVAILDIDFHHGNGTQEIFYQRPDILYVSIHADPSVRYPYFSGLTSEIGMGKGIGCNKNYPLPLGTGNKQYRRTLGKGLADIKNFHPRYLVVSAGFDTFEADPIGGFKLTDTFYNVIGQDIRALRLPMLIVQEGGYEVSGLGDIVCNFLEGLL